MKKDELNALEGNAEVVSAKEYRRIREEIGKHADSTKGERKHSIRALQQEIDAFNALDDRMEELQADIKGLNRTTSRLMKAQIVLIVAQVILAIVALILTSKLPEYILGP
jgi:molecular chaperone GrpE (heat shock protein)